MSGQRFSSLHAQNLNYLLLLREASIRDRVLACYECGLNKDSAAFFASASDEQLLHIAYSVDTLLCVPRYTCDAIRTMLDTPPGIRAAGTPKPPAVDEPAKHPAPAAAEGIGSNHRTVKVAA
jgi:hypothetical protein